VESQNSSEPAAGPEILLPNIQRFQIEMYERDAYRKFCIARLEHFLSLRRTHDEAPSADVRLHQKVVERAIYSAFRDCVSAGAGSEARKLLGEPTEHAA
jgi:hypothetical protein